MQRAWLLPLFVAAGTVVLIVSTQPSVRGASSRAVSDEVALGRSASGEVTIDDGAGVVPPDGVADADARERLRGLTAYVDPDFGFSVAVPAGWRAVVAAESEAQAAMHEPGYAVGFESPRERATDVFSDYLMIEILPDDESGLFETDGSRRRAVTIDGRSAWRDELVLPASVLGPIAVPSGEGAVSVGERARRQAGGASDLIVRQASLAGLGYTIGFYAIGERSREALMGDAFETMLRTFRLVRAPFDVS